MWAEDMITTKDDMLGLLGFALGPQALLAAFARELELEPERADALTPAERDRRIAELAASLLSLERREEALIERAAGEGIELPRRGDASPLAVLGVVIVAQAQTQAA
jgi:hypothetical protein